ncbi:hypothetical protein, partial [Eubacterium callanderi]|uniref:hypothetical protein n=1 Tax=Eubacterium callanderi TaxID=53442 RepID=UPI00210BEA38
RTLSTDSPLFNNGFMGIFTGTHQVINIVHRKNGCFPQFYTFLTGFYKQNKSYPQFCTGLYLVSRGKISMENAECRMENYGAIWLCQIDFNQMCKAHLDF